MLDLNSIENYIKNIDLVNSNNIMSLRLPQLKLYLKILGIPYYIKDMNLLVTTNIVERVLIWLLFGLTFGILKIVWILVFTNARTVRNRDILLLYIMCMIPDASSVMAHIKSNITERWYSVIRLTLRLTFLGLKQRKKSPVHTLLSALTIKRSIKLVAFHVYFRDIGLTKSSIQRSIRSFMKTEASQSTQLWARWVHDL